MLLLSFCGGWAELVDCDGLSLHSHFHVQPNYSVEVVLWLCCCWGYDKILPSLCNDMIILNSFVHPKVDFCSRLWSLLIGQNSSKSISYPNG